MGRGEVLELVDQQVATGPLHRPPERTVGQQHLDGGVDLLVEVDRPALGEPGPEGGEHLGQPADVVPRALDDLGIGQPQPDRGQPLDVRSDRIGVGPPDAAAGQQVVDQPPDVGLVEHGRRAAAVLGDDPQPERVERADPGPERRGAGLHLQLGLLVVGDGEHRRRLVPAVDVEVAETLGEHPGLARPGRRDDPRRAGEVADGGELVGGQVGVGRDERRHDGEAADVDGLAVDHRLGQRQRGARPAVDPCRATVGQRDVGRPVGRGDGGVVEPSGLDAPPPHGVADAGVVRVGPRQEVEAVE